jgi:hypothetical protein
VYNTCNRYYPAELFRAVSEHDDVSGPSARQGSVKKSGMEPFRASWLTLRSLDLIVLRAC